ncbi:helix-turn-helix domain-containing protein [Streptomyces marincola]|nr:pyridoxamine 5'-phosphate oxidase family protein [Streptomyces marincola]
MPVAGETRNHRSDIGRRVASRREQLGLSRQDVADRAGVAPQYLRYLEERPASPSQASLTRVARALETTVGELTGSEPPPAGGHTAPRGRLVELDTDECYRLVAEHSIGRIAVDTESGPAIVPVTYCLRDSAIVFPVSADEPDEVLVREARETAFEVDHLDEPRGVGWSVLVVGTTRRVTDAAEVAELNRLAAGWPDGEGRGGPADSGRAPGPGTAGEGEQRPAPGREWVRLRPERVTGRRVHLDQSVSRAAGASPRAGS